MNEWRETTLNELADFRNGKGISPDLYVTHGKFPVIGANGELARTDELLYVAPVVVIGRVGAYCGCIHRVKASSWVTDNAIVATPKPGVDFDFLYYRLKTLNLERTAMGSAQPLVTQGGLKLVRTVACDTEEQRAIGSVLASLDDKIELNRRMNETLEAMARALFQNWFVDATQTGLPKGWRECTLGESLSVLETGGRPKGGIKDIAEGVPSVGAESIVGIGHFDYSKTKLVPREFFAAMNKGHVRDGDVLLYKDGGRPGEFEPHVTMVGDGFPFSEFSINEHVYRLRTEPALPQSFLFFWLSSERTMDEMRNRGTGVAIPGLNSTAVRELPVLLPPASLLEKFDQRVSPLIRRIFANCNESRSLAALRDALLPKLLSGELRVPGDFQGLGKNPL